MPCINHPDVLTGLATCTRCGRDFCSDCTITLQGAVVCAGCKAEVVQDVKSGSVPGELPLAGLGARLVAIIIDQFIVGIIMVIISMVAGFVMVGSLGAKGMKGASGAMPALFTIGYLFMAIGLPILYEAVMLARGGQTVGKKALKIKVVREDGTDISSGQAWARAAGRSLMGITVILGLIDTLMIFSSPRTCLHDRLAKTSVVTWKR